ncbi:MAG: hypothetical protein JXR91_15360 [Deltaproteobacteria bacterium]|nr:hypothetical protein [Deltaproteobacteria bacterium]
MNKKISTKLLYGLIPLFFTGCLNSIDGTPCMSNSDCASNICTNGVCEEDTAGAIETDSNMETGSDFETDTFEKVTYDALDILLVVDNSNSMAEEQAIMSNSLATFINGFTAPLKNVVNSSLKDIRIAVTTTDMGLQWDGNPFIPDDYGAFGRLVSSSSRYLEYGNNGALLTDILDPTAEVALSSGQIQCTQVLYQCPEGWSCDNIDEYGEGTCTAPSPELLTFNCGELANKYFPIDPPYISISTNNTFGSTEAALSAACLVNTGNKGFGIEQQLIAATKALSDDNGFLRPNAITLVIVLSDEDDGSLKDGPVFFTSDEANNYDYTMINVALGENPEALFSSTEIIDKLTAAKAKLIGSAQAKDSTYLLSIAGVPITEKCQGFGDEIKECLDVPLLNGTVGDPAIEERVTVTGGVAYFYENACERYDDDVPITLAVPGTRFVTVAQEMGENAYIYSICNPDWNSAFLDVAKAIGSKIESSK